MLPIVKKAIIDIYTKELYSFINKFLQLPNEEKLLMFALLISSFKGHFYDKGVNWKSSISKRFSIDITILEPDSSLNLELFRIMLDDDNHIKLIDKTFGKLVDNLITLLSYKFGNHDYVKLMDNLITNANTRS